MRQKKWLFYGFVLTMVALCLWLGFWQLHRAEEKKSMQAQQKKLKQQPPLALTTESTPLQYQSASIQGHYITPTFFLDNQHYQHRFGYDIISPFESQDGGIVLVNRGWVAGDISRQTLPEIETSDRQISLRGYVYYPNNPGWQLGDILEKKAPDRYLVEQIDIGRIQSVLSRPIAGYTLRLFPDGGQTFVRAWPIVSMSPERHIGYAIQWFVMALALLFMLGYFIKKHYYAKSLSV